MELPPSTRPTAPPVTPTFVGSTWDAPQPTLSPPLALVHNAAPLGNSRVQVATTPVSTTILTDPDHDSVWVIPQDGSPSQQIELAVGTEPGDIQVVTVGTTTTAYVSLHNAGAVLAIPLGTATTAPLMSTTIPVCQSPRGMDAYPMSTGETLFIACADGVLVSLDPLTNTVQTTLPLADDLKDVVVMDGVDALVTRFRTAEVLVVNLQSGAFLTASLPSFASAGPAGMMVPDVAWQMIPLSGVPRTQVAIVHQLASTAVIDVAVSGGPPDAGSAFPPGDADGGTCTQNGYAPAQCAPAPGPQNSGNSATGCSPGVVASAITVVRLAQDDQPPVMLPVTLLPQLAPLTMVEVPPPAGTEDETVVVAGLSDSSMASLDLTESLQDASSGSPFACFAVTSQSGTIPDIAGLGPATSGVGLSVFFKQRDTAPPALTQFFEDDVEFLAEGSVTLADEPIVGEAGRNLFHQATPSLTSCASCHPNGRDDGHTWNFNPMGLRRTPALGGGLLATAPFHWDGAEPDIAQLMTDVFVGRMEGRAPTPDQVTAISNWLNGLPEAHAAAAPADPTQVAAGQALFQSAAVGCTACHSGAHFTNNQTMDVGTGGAFQVPTLLGVGSSPPYLHDGRAATLEDRFDPAIGGGDQHGQTSQLSPAQIEALVAYLRSL